MTVERNMDCLLVKDDGAEEMMKVGGALSRLAVPLGLRGGHTCRVEQCRLASKQLPKVVMDVSLAVARPAIVVKERAS
jgi:hypothetical protein